MRRPAFTLVELAVVLSLFAIVVPSTFLLVRTITARHELAQARLDAAQAMRSIAEEVRKDLRTGQFEGETLVVAAPCGRVTYTLERGVVTRDGGEACGGTRAIASHVNRFERSATGLEVAFARPGPDGRAHETTFLLARAPAAPPATEAR